MKLDGSHLPTLAHHGTSIFLSCRDKVADPFQTRRELRDTPEAERGALLRAILRLRYGALEATRNSRPLFSLAVVAVSVAIALCSIIALFTTIQCRPSQAIAECGKNAKVPSLVQ